MDKKILKNIIKPIIGILIILGIWYLLKCQCISLKTISPASIRDYIQGFGRLAPIVYVMAYILNTISVIPPIGFLSIAGGLLFGKVWGFLYVMIGCMIGTTCTFYISRLFGRDLVQKILKGKLKNLDDAFEKHGFTTVLILRVVYFPYEILNYASGLSKMKFKDFFFGTLIGLIPGVAISTIFGGALGGIKTFKDLFTGDVAIAVLLFTLALGIPLIYKLYKKKRK